LAVYAESLTAFGMQELQACSNGQEQEKQIETCNKREPSAVFILSRDAKQLQKCFSSITIRNTVIIYCLSINNY
jgi:hypothetical protein